MYKASYKDVKNIIDNTEWDDRAFKRNEQPYNREIAYYTPSNANWSYRIGIARGNDNYIYETVTVFGVVRGYRMLLTNEGYNA